MKARHCFFYVAMFFCFISSTLKAQIRGDVNLDNSVNISDVVAVIKVIAGDSQYRETADVNWDSYVNITDIVEIVKIIAEPQPDVKSYEKLSEDVMSFVKSNPNVTYDNISVFLDKKAYDCSSRVDNGMMYICTRDGMELHVDLFGSSMLSSEVGSNIDVEGLPDQIQKSLGYYEDIYAPDRTSGEIDNERLQLPYFPPATATALNDLWEHPLVNPNILLWSPWGAKHPAHNYVKNSVLNLAKTHNLSCDTICDFACTLKTMTKFSNYSLVVLECHGDIDGNLVVPYNNYWKLYLGEKGFGSTIVREENEIVDENGKKGKEKKVWWAIYVNPTVVKSFPTLNQKTIIWTIMCHAFTKKSSTKAAVEKCGAAAFMGASNTINAKIPLDHLNNFMAKFYKKKSGGQTAIHSFGGKENKLSIPYNYTDKDNIKVTGDYCHSVCGNKNVRFKYPENVKPLGNKPRGSDVNPYGQTPIRKSHGTVQKSNSQNDGGMEAGFYYKNVTTGKTEYVPFSEETIDDYQLYNYGDIITRCVMTGNTDDLDFGRYTYRTYLKTGDGIIYSDDEYEFEKTLCPDSNHPHAIDLGIGVKWSCCNVGASSPEQYGGYYAWGETEEKSTYNKKYYAYFDNAAYQNGKVWVDCYKYIGSDIGGTSYDVAHVKWGGSWRMPSLEHIKTLCNNCSSECTSMNGVYGKKFIGANGNCIFLPAAGYRSNIYLHSVGNYGIYWSSTQGPVNSYDAYYLDFYFGYTYSYFRDNGFTVRPVSE